MMTNILWKTPLKFILKLVTINLILQKKSVGNASSNSKNYNYGGILFSKCFTDEHINSNDPNKTASDNEIIAQSTICQIASFLLKI